MNACPHCGVDVGDASPAYCPTCRGPLLGQRREDVAIPPPGSEFDRSAEVATEEPAAGTPYQSFPQPAPVRSGSTLKNVLRVGFLMLVLGPAAWGFIDNRLNGADRGDSGAVVDAGDLTVTDLRAGDCFDLPDGIEGDEDIMEVRAVPCAEPHENEVYVVTNYPGSGSYPGDVAIFEFADEFCLTAFDTYAGIDYESSVLDFGYLYPNRDGWAEGDYEITCVLYDMYGNELVGSMRGAGR